MVENLMFYLTNGLIKADFKNLNVRKLGADTSHEFIEWCGLIGPETPNELIKFNEKVYKNELYIEFIQDNPDFAPKAKRTISRTEFYRWLNSYALFKTNLMPTDGRDLNGRWMIFLTNKE